MTTKEEYYRQHARCPRCGHDEIERTCIGIMAADWTQVEDQNAAYCPKCQWCGIVHDLAHIRTNVKTIHADRQERQ